MSRDVTDNTGFDRNYGLAIQDNLFDGTAHVDSRISASAVDSEKNPEDVVAGEWRHAALIFDGVAETHRLYVDGTEVPDSPQPSRNLFDGDVTSIVTGGEWYFGVDPLGFDPSSPDPRGPLRHFSGQLDDWAMWDEALSAQDIMKVYQGGLSGIDAPTSLVPEPTTCGLLMMSFFGSLSMRRL